MAKKRAILPKEIQGLLESGDVEQLKQLFARCEPNAPCSRSNRTNSNIFSMTPLPREFAVWAKEQGADVNFPDGYGFVPIFSHAGVSNGDVQLLIDLGAKIDIMMYDGTTPLHEAAVHGQMKAVKALLDAGAEVDAGMGMAWGTPLESTVRQGRLSWDTLLEVCTLLLAYGARITERARTSFQVLAIRLQKASRRKKHAASPPQQSQAFIQLMELFKVDLNKEMNAQESVPLLTIKEIFKKDIGFQNSFNRLWGYLIPEQGRARTAQGEAIRIVGRVRHELMDNGGLNWDDDYRKMLHILPHYFRLGNPLQEGDVKDAEKFAHTLADNIDEDKLVHQLLCYTMMWVWRNSQLIMPLPADYTR